MRVAVTGATGNVGTSLLECLRDDDAIASVVGVARRRPDLSMPKVEWVEADVASSPLAPIFSGCDAVVHLAWLIQPSHDLEAMRRVNVDGSRRVFEAAAEASVRKIVYASSVGAYGPGPKDRFVDESWPASGIESSFYSRHKAAVEALLDDFEQAHPDITVVRLRPALVFKKEAASEIRRLFLGPLFPSPLVRPGLVPLLPDIADLKFQAVHSYDVGRAYQLALVREVAGAFNVAADPVLDLAAVAALLRARTAKVGASVVRTTADLTWRLHLQPSPPGWVDMGLNAPLMDATRAREELGWTPRYSAVEALEDLLEGLRSRSGYGTPPLESGRGGPARVREFLTGVGRKQSAGAPSGSSQGSRS